MTAGRIIGVGQGIRVIDPAVSSGFHGARIYLATDQSLVGSLMVPLDTVAVDSDAYTVGDGTLAVPAGLGGAYALTGGAYVNIVLDHFGASVNDYSYVTCSIWVNGLPVASGGGMDIAPVLDPSADGGNATYLLNVAAAPVVLADGDVVALMLYNVSVTGAATVFSFASLGSPVTFLGLHRLGAAPA